MSKALGAIALSLAITSCSARFPDLAPDTSWADGSLSIYYFDSGNRNILKIVNLDGTAVRTLLDFPISEYEISASGTTIAFSDHSAGRCGVAALVSGAPVWIPGPCADFELSPDGQSVAYEPVVESGRPEELRIFLVAEEQSYLAAESKGPIVGPRWSKSGSEIFYSDLFTGKHYSVNLNGAGVTEVGKADEISDFWRLREDLDGMHFNQWDSPKYVWYRTLSPTGDFLAECREGSLFLVDHKRGDSRLLLENTGSFNPDIGVTGFSHPVWTRDERYIVGEIDGSIVVVEVDTGRAGIVVQGTHALAHIPGYHPGPKAIGEMYDSSVKMYGQ